MKNRFGCLDMRTPCKVVFYTNSRMVGKPETIHFPGYLKLLPPVGGAR